MKISDQIRAGLLISPKSRKRLLFSADSNLLITGDSEETFQIINGVPLLIEDVKSNKDFYNQSMETEYRSYKTSRSLFERIKKKIYGELHTKKSRELIKMLDSYSEAHVLLGIGAGPTRDHPLLTNLNISNYQNVEIVADAHSLPYADNSVDAIHVAAVIEHLYNPMKAIAEMYRVLKKGGIVISETPFMQPYHGYPHHYQNLTLTGHSSYYSQAGFEIVDSGTSVGPTVSIIIIISKYIFAYFPPVLNKICGTVFLIFGMLILKPLDLIINKRSDSHLMSSLTFVVAKK